MSFGGSLAKGVGGYLAYSTGILIAALVISHSNASPWVIFWILLACMGLASFAHESGGVEHRNKISKEISSLIIGGSSHMNLRDLRDHLKEKKLL